MSFTSLLFIIIGALCVGILLGLMLRKVSGWLVHFYRRFFFKPKMLKYYLPKKKQPVEQTGQPQMSDTPPINDPQVKRGPIA